MKTLALLLLSLPMFGATFYISKTNGLDTRSSATAQSKSTPWAHIPGMAGATSNAAAYSPSAGDNFIFYGGDTWGSADLGGVNLTYSGSNGNPIYLGVDPTWFMGASWTRPIWNCQNTNCGDSSPTLGNVVWLAGNYLTLDNIEITGYKFDGGGNIVSTYGNNITVENLYIHGWSHTGGSCGASTNDPYAISMNFSNFGGEGTGVLFFQNVIDGSDSGDIGGNYCFGGILHGNVVRDNVIRYVYNGMNGVFNVIDGNLIEFNNNSTTGDHCNMMYPQAIWSGNVIQISNNVVRHAVCPGGTTIFTLANSANPSYVAYAFNNVLYDNEVDSDKGFSIGGSSTNGTFYYYNNTVVTAGGYCMQNGSAGTGTAYYSNFHCISPQSICNFVNGTCTSNGGNVNQTAAVADANTGPQFNQYTASQTYAYSPTAATNSTVGSGTNYTTADTLNCTAYPTLCSDATYPEYNSTNHTVALRTTNSRPSVGSWDAGAYSYAPAAASSITYANVCPGSIPYVPTIGQYDETGNYNIPVGEELLFDCYNVSTGYYELHYALATPGTAIGSIGTGETCISCTTAFKAALCGGTTCKSVGKAQWFRNGQYYVFSYQDKNSTLPGIGVPTTLSGTVNTSGTAVTWVSGSTFVVGQAPGQILINGSLFTVSTYNSSTSLTLSTSAGSHSGVAYSQGLNTGDPGIGGDNHIAIGNAAFTQWVTLPDTGSCTVSCTGGNAQGFVSSGMRRNPVDGTGGEWFPIVAPDGSAVAMVDNLCIVVQAAVNGKPCTSNALGSDIEYVPISFGASFPSSFTTGTVLFFNTVGGGTTCATGCNLNTPQIGYETENFDQLRQILYAVEFTHVQDGNHLAISLSGSGSAAVLLPLCDQGLTDPLTCHWDEHMAPSRDGYHMAFMGTYDAIPNTTGNITASPVLAGNIPFYQEVEMYNLPSGSTLPTITPSAQPRARLTGLNDPNSAQYIGSDCHNRGAGIAYAPDQTYIMWNSQQTKTNGSACTGAHGTFGYSLALIPTPSITITSPTSSTLIQTPQALQLTATVANAPGAYKVIWKIDSQDVAHAFDKDYHNQLTGYVYSDAWCGQWCATWPNAAYNGDGPHFAQAFLYNTQGALLAVSASVTFNVRIEGMSNNVVNALPNLSGGTISGKGEVGVLTFDLSRNGNQVFVDGVGCASNSITGCSGGTTQTNGWQIPNFSTTWVPNGTRLLYTGYGNVSIADPYMLPLTFAPSAVNTSTNVITVANANGAHYSRQGSVVTFSTSGTLPSGLASGCQYEWTSSATNTNTATLAISGGTATATLSGACGSLSGSVPVYVRNIQFNDSTGAAICDGLFTGSISSTTLTWTEPSACNGASSSDNLEIAINPYFAIVNSASPSTLQVSASCTNCSDTVANPLVPGSAVSLGTQGTGTHTILQRARSAYWTPTGNNGEPGQGRDFARYGGPAYVLTPVTFSNGAAPMRLNPLYWEMHLVAGGSAKPLCTTTSFVQNTDLSYSTLACNASGVTWTEVDDGGQSNVITVDGSGNVTPCASCNGWAKVTVACVSCAAGSVSLQTVTIYVQVQTTALSFPTLTSCGPVSANFATNSACPSIILKSAWNASVLTASAFTSAAKQTTWLANALVSANINAAYEAPSADNNLSNPASTGPCPTWGASPSQLFYQEGFALANNIGLEYDMWWLVGFGIHAYQTPLAALVNNFGFARQTCLTALGNYFVAQGNFPRLGNDDEISDVAGNFYNPSGNIGGANFTSAGVSAGTLTLNVVNMTGGSWPQAYSQTTGLGNWIEVIGATTNSGCNGWMPVTGQTASTITLTALTGCTGASITSVSDPAMQLVLPPYTIISQANTGYLPSAPGNTTPHQTWSSALTSIGVSGTGITVNWTANAIPNGTAIRIWNATTANLNTLCVITSGTNSFTCTYGPSQTPAASGTYTSGTDASLYITVDTLSIGGANPLTQYFNIMNAVTGIPSTAISVKGTLYSASGSGPGTLATYENAPNASQAWLYTQAPPFPAIYGYDGSPWQWAHYTDIPAITTRAFQISGPRSVLWNLNINFERFCQSFTFNPTCDRPNQLDNRPETYVAQIMGSFITNVRGGRFYNFGNNNINEFGLGCCGWTIGNGTGLQYGLNPFNGAQKLYNAMAVTNSFLEGTKRWNLQPETNKPNYGDFFGTDAHLSNTQGNIVYIHCRGELPYGTFPVPVTTFMGGTTALMTLDGYTKNLQILGSNSATVTQEWCASPSLVTAIITQPSGTQAFNTQYFQAPPGTLPFSASTYLVRISYSPFNTTDAVTYVCTNGCSIPLDNHATPVWKQEIFADSFWEPIFTGNPVQIPASGAY